jgi:putative oxidoreductase
MVYRLARWFMESPEEVPPFATAVLDRCPVGAIFLLEGILKFHLPQEFGVGRFARIGIPMPQFFAPFDGAFEIGCGVLLLLGLFTRPAVIPMIINMFVAICTTKLPVLAKEGFWKMAHAALLDYAMLFGLTSILIAGAGAWSLDEKLRFRRQTKLVPGSFGSSESEVFQEYHNGCTDDAGNSQRHQADLKATGGVSHPHHPGWSGKAAENTPRGDNGDPGGSALALEKTARDG